VRGISAVVGAVLALFACCAMGQAPDIMFPPEEAGHGAPPGLEHMESGMVEPGMPPIPGEQPNVEEESPAVTEVATQPPPQRRYKARRRRDPFWPINHVQEVLKDGGESGQAVSPGVKRPENLGKPDWQGAEKQIVIQGIVEGPGGTFVALINEQIVQAGETISVTFGQKLYRWKIASITSKDSIKFDRLSVRRTGK